jgi:DnaJ-class molecular chaperone
MSTQTITVTLCDDNGDEQEHILPAKNEVCSRCEGYGTHLNPSIGSHAYTAEEFYDSFDEEGREEYFRRGGIYDVTCECCKGKNVVLLVDEDACKSNPTLKPIFEAWEKQEIRARREMDDWRAEQRHEAMMLGEEY